VQITSAEAAASISTRRIRFVSIKVDFTNNKAIARIKLASGMILTGERTSERTNLPRLIWDDFGMH
jgi:hypothetical protein